MAVTLMDCHSRLCNALDGDLVVCTAWTPRSQNPPADYAVQIDEDFNAVIQSDNTIVYYGPDGKKGETIVGCDELRAKIEANIARQTPEEEPTPQTTTLDQLYEAIPIKSLQSQAIKQVK